MKLDIKELHEKYESLMGKEIELNGWIKSNRLLPVTVPK